MMRSGEARIALRQSISLLAIVLVLTLAELQIKVDCQEQLSIESRQQKDNDDLTDTIKYLEKLDKYFSQIARPRFGRSEYKQPHRMQPSWLPRLPLREAAGSSPEALSTGQLVGGLETSRLSPGELLELARGRAY